MKTLRAAAVISQPNIVASNCHNPFTTFLPLMTHNLDCVLAFQSIITLRPLALTLGIFFCKTSLVIMSLSFFVAAADPRTLDIVEVHFPRETRFSPYAKHFDQYFTLARGDVSGTYKQLRADRSFM